MNHKNNCQICREGIEKLLPEQKVFAVLDKVYRRYYHVIASDSLEAVKILHLTLNDTWVIQLTKKAVRKLIKRGKEGDIMKTDLETQMAELQKWAMFGQKVAELYTELGAGGPKKKKRVRRTKAQIEAAKQETTASAVAATVKPKPKRSHAKKKPAVAQDGATASATT